MARVQRVQEEVAAPKKIKVRGKPVMRDLSTVKPCPWPNPNFMTPFQFQALKDGMLEDGWLASEALLVWGKDDKGKEQNIVMGGNHRWTAATELGLKAGPMVFLDDLTEAQAKAFTIKMNSKRGQPQEANLSLLLREIQHEIGSDNLSMQFGIEEEKLMVLLAEPAVRLEGEGKETNGTSLGGLDLASGKMSQVRMVQLFFSPEQHAVFEESIKQLSVKYGTKNATDTVFEAIKRAGSAKK
jgi:hypothetical protein